MNRKMIMYILGKMLGAEAVLLLLPAFVGALYKESSAVTFLITAAILVALYLYLEERNQK